MYVSATALSQICEKQECEREANDRGRDMRGGGESEDDDKQEDAGTPFLLGTLQGMGDADGGIDGGIEREGGEDLVVGRGGGADNLRGEAVEGKCDVSAFVTVEPARNPPDRGSERKAGEDEGQTHE